MIVTKLEETGKKKFRVELDYELVMTLYASEIRKFHIKVDQEISLEVVQQIENDILLPRAKNKAIYILKFSDRTQSELTSRLKQAEFSPNIITKAVAYVKEYGYINDDRFAESYIRVKSSNKSRRQLQMELANKGIDRDKINQYMDENETDDLISLKTQVEKRLRGKGPFTSKDLQKHYAYFARRGYGLSDIKKVIQEYEQDSEEDLYTI